MAVSLHEKLRPLLVLKKSNPRILLSRPQSQALQLHINPGAKFEQLETKPVFS